MSVYEAVGTVVAFLEKVIGPTPREGEKLAPANPCPACLEWLQSKKKR